MSSTSPAAPAKTSPSQAPTPMLKQYHALKNDHQDCILFFRLGDFYEMFFEDAKIASRALDLVLTSRGKAPSQKIPMCGIPYHSADNYIARLIKKGHKVAICEQVEDPSVAKGIVKRAVTRVITSGTYLDEKSAEPRHLLALTFSKSTAALSFMDPASGTIYTNEYPQNISLLADKVSRLSLFECLYPEAEESLIKELFHQPVLRNKEVTLTPLADWYFNNEMTHQSLCDHFGVANLHGFGIEESQGSVNGCGALLEYLKQMNQQSMQHIDRIVRHNDEDFCLISAAAYQGLEIDTLIKTLDQTITPLGRRAFRSWLTHPLKDKEKIIARQQAIAALLSHPATLTAIKDLFETIGDVQKHLSRISCGYTHARDLFAIRQSLSKAPLIIEALSKAADLSSLYHVDDPKKVRELLERAINESIPLSKPEGHIINPGYHKELDELRDLQKDGRLWLKSYQQKEIERTSISSLKVGFNKVFGYYIEITRTHSKSVPQDYIRKQTLTNAERYITPELKEYEEKILTAEEKIIRIEQQLITELREEILRHARKLHAFCAQIAQVDCLYSLALLAQSPGYCLPAILNGTSLLIKEGRHPVVERMLTETFIANDVSLDCEGDHLMILTGPNMSGKSTYIRQTALLVIMAQTGSFIPAESAQIGIVDKIFTRIGAHDDIKKGQSTFMVEMNEAADILHNLTDRSLVILDEIGRGTSTFDGLSLAWAIAEYLKETKARAMFATHFHELTALAEEHSGVKNYNVAVKKWKDDIIFLHKIIPGSTDDSYGIYVAKLAGIPEAIVTKAKKLLSQIELKSNLKEDLKRNFQREEQVTLFEKAPDPVLEEIKEDLESLDVNQMTPIDALKKLQDLKEKL